MSASPDRPTLTPRQAKALRVITESVAARGFPPSTRELCTALGLTSTSSIHHVLTRLEWKGYLRRTEGINRGIRVLDADPTPRRCPHCGGDVSEVGT